MLQAGRACKAVSHQRRDMNRDIATYEIAAEEELRWMAFVRMP